MSRPDPRAERRRMLEAIRRILAGLPPPVHRPSPDPKPRLHRPPGGAGAGT